MMKIPRCLFATQHAAWPFFRQTEDGQGHMSACVFTLDPGEETDWLAVLDEPPAGLLTRAPRERRVVFITEPPEVKVYSPFYLRQFGTIISPYPIRGGHASRLLLENPCLNWHYGVDGSSAEKTSRIRTLQELREMPVPRKTKLLSVICSTKTFTEAQRKRITFVEKLKARFGSQIDIFGRGRRPIADKAEAIDAYRYHLVLENNYMDNFWTEKLSDAWLGYAFPVYLGAPNAPRHFPQGGMLALRPDDDAGNLDVIERLIAEDPWESRLPVLRQCRDMVLSDNNLFVRLDKLMRCGNETARHCPSLPKPQKIHGTGRLCTALLCRAARYGLYTPFAS